MRSNWTIIAAVVLATILEAHYIGGMSLRAIERKLLLSKTTVQKYHRAGLEKLGEILEEGGKSLLR